MKFKLYYGLAFLCAGLSNMARAEITRAQELTAPWLSDDPALISAGFLSPEVAQVSNDAARVALGTATPVELYRAIAMAVNTHPAVQASLNSVLEQRNMIDSAKSDFYPRISADLSSGRVSNHGHSQMAAITLSQIIYDFGKTRSRVDQAQGLMSRSVAKLIKQVDEVAHSTAESYINVHRYNTLLTIAEKQVSALSDIYERSKLRAGSGLATQSDPIQAKSRLESAEANKVEMETLLSQWREQLGLLTGLAPNVMIGSIPDDLARAANLAAPVDYENIPELLEARTERDVAVSALELSKAQRYPTISLEASSDHALSGVNPNNGEERGSFNTVMLKGTALLYQGGGVSAQIRAAHARALAADEMIRDAKLRVDEKIKKTVQEVWGEKKRLSVLERRYSSILQTADLYQEEYKLGNRSILDLLNAEQEAYFAAVDREGSKYAYVLGVVDYIATTGKSRDIYRINDSALLGMETRHE